MSGPTQFVPPERLTELERENRALRAELEARRGAAEAGEQQRALLEAVLDRIADGILMVDEAGRIGLYNGRMREITGWDAERAGSEGLPARLVPPGARAGRLRETFDDFEVDWPLPDGTSRSLLVSGRRLDHQRGGWLLLAVRDITERKRAEESLAARRAHLRTVLDTAVDGIITIDSRGRVESFNRAAEAMFGFKADEIIGHNVARLMPEPDAGNHDGYLSRYLETGEARIIGIGREVTGRRRDGSLFPLDLGVAEMSGDGDRRFTAILRDITQRKAAERELLATDAALRRLHEITTFPAPALEDKVDALLVMGCERLGLPVGVLGSVDGDRFKVRSVLDSEGLLAPGTTCALRETLCQETLGSSTPVRHPDARALREQHRGLGDRPLGAYIGIPVRLGDRVFGTLSFFGPEPREPFSALDDELLKLMAQWIGGALWREETQSSLRDYEMQLQQAQKMEAIGTLAGGIAHDFNNLLMGIMGVVGIAQGRLPLQHEVQPILAKVKDEVTRGAALTRQILAFSRRRDFDATRLLPDDVIRRTEVMLRRLLGEDVELSLSLGARRVRVLMGEGQLEQVLMNLVVNARHAMPDGGRLEVRTARYEVSAAEARRVPELSGGPHFLVEVSDSGVGMTEAVRARVFEPFFTTKGPGKGTGLGLSTVYGIVKRSGGHIELHSEPGRGTRIRILLPEALDRPPEADGPVAAEAPDARDAVVLLVEDEVLVRMAVEHYLLDEGCRVLTAATGPEALEALEAHAAELDLVVTDMVLPGVSGRVVAEEVRARRPDVPVLFMSAHSPDRLRAEGRLPEGAPALQKPFTADALRGRLAELLGRDPDAGGERRKP